MELGGGLAKPSHLLDNGGNDSRQNALAHLAYRVPGLLQPASLLGVRLGGDALGEDLEERLDRIALEGHCLTVWRPLGKRRRPMA